MKHIFSINRHDAPITHTLQQLKNATGSMPLDGLLLFITFSWLCNSVTVVIVQLKLIQIYAVDRIVDREKNLSIMRNDILNVEFHNSCMENARNTLFLQNVRFNDCKWRDGQYDVWNQGRCIFA